MFENLAVEGDTAILATQTPIARLQTAPDLKQLAREPPNAGDERPFRLGADPSDRTALEEEVLDHLGHEPAFLCLGSLADETREVELLAGEAFQCRPCDALELLLVDLFDEAVEHLIAGDPSCVVVAQEALDKVRGHDIADDVKDLV